MFNQDLIPTPLAMTAYVALALLSTVVLPQIFSQLTWYYVARLYVVAPAVAFCSTYGFGLTDYNIGATYAKVAILAVGAWSGATGGVIAGLAACGVIGGVINTARTVISNMKVAHMTLTSPRSMAVSQTFGVLIGCIVSPGIFWIFYTVVKGFGMESSEYALKWSTLYRNVANLSVQGIQSLPKHCILLFVVLFIVAIMIDLVRDLAGPRVARLVPLPMAMAIPLYVRSPFVIDMCMGRLMLFVWECVHGATAKELGPTVASGLMCGDAIWLVVKSVLSLTEIMPPICMRFFSRSTNNLVEGYLKRGSP